MNGLTAYYIGLALFNASFPFLYGGFNNPAAALQWPLAILMTCMAYKCYRKEQEEDKSV